MTTDDNGGIENLLDYLRDSRGYDFSTYKRTTLTRRIHRRMDAVGVAGFSGYRDYLEVHADEFEMLATTILINVTSFFREPATWEFLRTDVLPKILANNDSAPLRFWCAGCASGQEAYSLAILLAESLGIDEFRDRVKIYATDIDEEALAIGRQGTYSAKDIKAIPEELAKRYFERSEDAHTFRSDLRRSVIFGRHDLTVDAPISRLDVLICRNTLMYFNAEAQAAIVRRLYSALRSSGYLFLGKAETMMTHGNLFVAEEPKLRFFTKVHDVEGGARVAGAQLGSVDGQTHQLQALASHASQLSQIVLHRDGRVATLNHAARVTFGIDTRDVGRMFQDLEVSYRPVELRGAIGEAITQRRPVQIENAERIRAGGEVQKLQVMVSPLIMAKEIGGVLIEFLDVTHQQTLQDELERTRRELETAYEELQSANEELETTNEELQSTVEELETTNEELQSTVEELETTNEELRSTNEELETMNEELRVRTLEVNEANSFLSATLNSLTVAIAVLDPSQIVRTWSSNAEELWGLRPGEVVGTDFFSLAIGLPVEEMREPVHRCLRERSLQEVVVDATNRRGRHLRCRVGCSPLAAAPDDGVVIAMHEDGGMATSR